MIRIPSNIHHRRRSRQAGLTLIELLIVLVVLVGVAGILVPLFPDMQQRTHGASGADNMKEIVKAVELHKASTGSYPDSWDSLIDANDVVAAATDLQVLDLTAGVGPDVLAALNDAGITEAFEHTDFADATINQTLDGGGAVDSIGANEVAELTATGIANLGLEATGAGIAAYVAFGLGSESTMVGESMVDAPIHYLEGGESPIENYARFVVVFAVPDEGPLRLASVAGIEDGDELASLGGHLNEYYESLE